MPAIRKRGKAYYRLCEKGFFPRWQIDDIDGKHVCTFQNRFKAKTFRHFHHIQNGKTCYSTYEYTENTTSNLMKL